MSSLLIKARGYLSLGYTCAANAVIKSCNNPHKTAIGAISVGYLASMPVVIGAGIAIEGVSLAKRIFDEKCPMPLRRRTDFSNRLRTRKRAFGLMDEDIRETRIFSEDMKFLAGYLKIKYSEYKLRFGYAWRNRKVKKI